MYLVICKFAGQEQVVATFDSEDDANKYARAYNRYGGLGHHFVELDWGYKPHIPPHNPEIPEEYRD